MSIRKHKGEIIFLFLLLFVLSLLVTQFVMAVRSSETVTADESAPNNASRFLR